MNHQLRDENGNLLVDTIDNGDNTAERTTYENGEVVSVETIPWDSAPMPVDEPIDRASLLAALDELGDEPTAGDILAALRSALG